MEEKIKRLKEHLRKVFPTLQGGKTGFWAVGEGEIWKVENPGEECPQKLQKNQRKTCSKKSKTITS